MSAPYRYITVVWNEGHFQLQNCVVLSFVSWISRRLEETTCIVLEPTALAERWVFTAALLKGPVFFEIVSCFVYIVPEFLSDGCSFRVLVEQSKKMLQSGGSYLPVDRR